jgi:hypothetical protein
MPEATTLSPSAAAPPIWNSLNLRLEEPALMTISLFRGAMAAGHHCQAWGRAAAGLRVRRLPRGRGRSQRCAAGTEVRG